MRREITVEEIQKAICKHFNVKVGELKSKRRSKDIVLPRQVAMYLCRKYTAEPYSFIGFKFGRREHSTVLYALKSINKKLAKDPGLLMRILTLETNLRA